jgi:hypothetical protein
MMGRGTMDSGRGRGVIGKGIMRRGMMGRGE